jgi:hypothetical protein
MVTSFRLRQLWNRLESFPDKTEAELDRLVHVIVKELDAIEYGRQLGATAQLIGNRRFCLLPSFGIETIRKFTV